MVSNPRDRRQAAADAAESVGGKMLGFWFSFGEFDGAFSVDAPDNTTAAAISMVVGASGALSRLERTVLVTMDEAQGAMRKAAGASCRAPASADPAH